MWHDGVESGADQMDKKIGSRKAPGFFGDLIADVRFGSFSTEMVKADVCTCPLRPESDRCQFRGRLTLRADNRTLTDLSALRRHAQDAGRAVSLHDQRIRVELPAGCRFQRGDEFLFGGMVVRPARFLNSDWSGR